MESLPILRTVLLASAGVTTKRTGGIHFNKATQGDALPNIVMAAISPNEKSDSLSQQGPTGLLNERVRIWARAETVRDASGLGTAIDTALHGFSGMVNGAHVQLIEKVMTHGDYDDGAKVQRAIVDVRVHWSRAP